MLCKVTLWYKYTNTENRNSKAQLLKLLTFPEACIPFSSEKTNYIYLL